MKNLTKRGLMTFGLFSFLALLPMSCGLFCNDSCGCGPTAKPQSLMIKSFETFTVNESGIEVPVSELKSYDEIFKTFKIKDAEYRTQSSIEPISYGVFGTAFACTPLSPSTENTLYLIQIINQKEFTLADGTTYFEGNNITSLFGMNHFFASELTTIKNFTAPGLRLTFEDYFKIGFLENPEKELNLKFTIRLVFDDAQEFLLADQELNIR